MCIQRADELCRAQVLPDAQVYWAVFPYHPAQKHVHALTGRASFRACNMFAGTLRRIRNAEKIMMKMVQRTFYTKGLISRGNKSAFQQFIICIMVFEESN